MPAGSAPRLHPSAWLLAAIALLALALRATSLDRTSAFMDEALNVAYGRLFLASPLSPPDRQTLYWHNGWYLWPAAAALADRLGGLLAVRALAAALGAVTTLLVGLLAARLFSRTTAVCAATFYALLAPAVFTARLGTYDAAAIAAMAAGTCLFARAWTTQSRSAWAGAFAFFFAGFLAKYVVAALFPLIVVLAVVRSRRALLWLALPLTAACAAYALRYRAVLRNVLEVLGADDARLRLSSADLWSLYVFDRADLWVLVAASLLVLLPLPGESAAARHGLRARAWVLWAAAATLPLLRFVSSASDTRFFKHAAYSLVFLAPLAAEGVRRLCLRVAGGHRAAAAVAACAAMGVGLAAMGGSFRPQRLVFWPDLSAASSYLLGKLDRGSRLATNDLGVLQDVSPPLPFRSVTGPYAFQYGGLGSSAAYALAVKDGVFDYVLLTPPGPEEAVAGFQAAARSALPGRYTRVMRVTDPVLSMPIELWARRAPPPRRADGPQIELLADPPAGRGPLEVHGQVRRAAAGWRVRIDVLTDRWYPQGAPIVLTSGYSRFRYPVHLGRPCGAVVRAELLDGEGRAIAADVAPFDAGTRECRSD